MVEEEGLRQTRNAHGGTDPPSCAKDNTITQQNHHRHRRHHRHQHPAKWMLNYPFQLMEQLQNAGFAAVTNPPACGWRTFSHVSALRVGRGSLDVNGTDEQPYGDPAEIGRVEEVLRREYPFVEILILCATLVGPVLTLFALCWWNTWASRKAMSRVDLHLERISKGKIVCMLERWVYRVAFHSTNSTSQHLAEVVISL